MKPFIKITLPLVFIAAIHGHTYTGDYCGEDDECYQLQPNGKVVFTQSIGKEKTQSLGTYTNTDNIFYITVAEPANRNSFMASYKKERNAALDESVAVECSVIEFGDPISGKDYEPARRGKRFPNTQQGLNECKKYVNQHNWYIKSQRQGINAMKYSDELFYQFSGYYVLVENSLNKLDRFCDPVGIYTKKGAEKSVFSLGSEQLCLCNRIHAKCDGNIYDVFEYKCENDTLIITEQGLAKHKLSKQKLNETAKKVDPNFSKQIEGLFANNNKIKSGAIQGSSSIKHGTDCKEKENSSTKSGSGGMGGLLGGGGGFIGKKSKDGVKAPNARDIDMGSDASRSKAEIMAVVNARMPDIENIYNKYLKLKPGFSGKVTLKFTIAPSGDIVSISIVSSTTNYDEFDNAIKDQVSKWKWKQIKSGDTTPTIPFNFAE